MLNVIHHNKTLFAFYFAVNTRTSFLLSKGMGTCNQAGGCIDWHAEPVYTIAVLGVRLDTNVRNQTFACGWPSHIGIKSWWRHVKRIYLFLGGRPLTERHNDWLLDRGRARDDALQRMAVRQKLRDRNNCDSIRENDLFAVHTNRTRRPWNDRSLEITTLCENSHTNW